MGLILKVQNKKNKIKAIKRQQSVPIGLKILAKDMEPSIISRFHVSVVNIVLFVDKLLTVLQNHTFIGLAYTLPCKIEHGFVFIGCIIGVQRIDSVGQTANVVKFNIINKSTKRVSVNGFNCDIDFLAGIGREVNAVMSPVSSIEKTWL